MRAFRQLLAVLVLVLSACQSAEPKLVPEEPLFRSFAASDAALLGVDQRLAIDVVKGGLTKVATRDFRLQPNCRDQTTFFLASPEARWLGGDPGCMVVRLSLPDQTAPMAFNPFCQLGREVLVGDCLQLDYSARPADDMMSQLRPAARVEVLLALSPDIEVAIELLPAALRQTWYVAQPNAGQDFRLAPLYGDQAVNIIVPSDIKLAGGRFGHNQVYLHGPYLFTDPLCQTVKQYGLAALPIRFAGPELSDLELCQQ